jgi:hypothetical protein
VLPRRSPPSSRLRKLSPPWWPPFFPLLSRPRTS